MSLILTSLFHAKVPCGFIFKDETIGSEMIEILQILQEKYVPTKVCTLEDGTEKTVVGERIFVGGDQLSEERARNAQSAMSDGDTELECLEGLMPKNEDWHAIRYMYVVSLHWSFKY